MKGWRKPKQTETARRMEIQAAEDCAAHFERIGMPETAARWRRRANQLRAKVPFDPEKMRGAGI